MPDAAGFTICEPPKPEIQVVAGNLHLLATQAEEAIIAADLPVYQRGKHLVRPATQEVPASKGRMTVAACFVPIAQPAMLDVMAQAARWTQFNVRAKANRAVDAPRPVADVLLSRFGGWHFSPVCGVVTTPTLRPDHSVLSVPGYDATTRLYLADDPTLTMPTVPANPTRDHAAAALALLDALLGGFPFVGAVDRSVALSALLTPVCRGAMAVAPLHVFRASTAGTGKSYLADLASAIATGRPCPAAAAGHDARETDSRLVGLLMAGYPLISLDNVNGELGSDLLCQGKRRGDSTPYSC